MYPAVHPHGYFITPGGEAGDWYRRRWASSFPQYRLFDFSPDFAEAMDVSIGRLFNMLAASQRADGCAVDRLVGTDHDDGGVLSACRIGCCARWA
jgi:hypothetical protein